VALLDVSAVVTLAWDANIHHLRIREWFAANACQGSATCPVTETGFVRVSANPRVLASPIGIADAQRVLAALPAVGDHRFLVDDVSPVDEDVPKIVGHRRVTGAYLAGTKSAATGGHVIIPVRKVSVGPIGSSGVAAAARA
jgi:toxin-antitoxin system PIN domain toxin